MPRPSRNEAEIYTMIQHGREEDLLRRDLRKLFAPRGLTYHKPGKRNQMFDKDELFEVLVRELVFEEIRAAFALRRMAQGAPAPVLL